MGDASEWEKVSNRVVLMRAAFRDMRGGNTHTLGSFKSIHPPMLSQVNILLTWITFFLSFLSITFEASLKQSNQQPRL